MILLILYGCVFEHNRVPICFFAARKREGKYVAVGI